MHDSYTLVIIDVQPKFDGSRNERMLRGVKAEVIKAKDLNNPIIVVEYKDWGPTCPSIRKVIGDYWRACTITKLKTGGAKEVNSVLRNMLDGHNIRICGIYTDVCVLATVRGLNRSKNINSIKVVEDACATGFGNNLHTTAIKKMGRFKNVDITYSNAWRQLVAA